MRNLIIGLTAVFLVAGVARKANAEIQPPFLMDYPPLIETVSILPSDPTAPGELAILAQGKVAYFTVVADTLYSSAGTDQQLDIYFFFTGSLPFIDGEYVEHPEVTQWSADVSTGELPADTYNLTVNTYIGLPRRSALAFGPYDTYSTTYAVVPEPSMLVLAGIGIFSLFAYRFGLPRFFR